MNDAGLVSFHQPFSHLGRDIDGVAQRQRPPFDPLLERLPLVMRHHEVELPVVGLPDVVDGASIGVVEDGGRLRHLEESLLGRLVRG